MTTVDEYMQEFLDILLKEDAVYPWNPADPEAEAYFVQQQKDYSLSDSLLVEDLFNIDNSLYDN